MKSPQRQPESPREQSYLSKFARRGRESPQRRSESPQSIERKQGKGEKGEITKGEKNEYESPPNTKQRFVERESEKDRNASSSDSEDNQKLRANDTNLKQVKLAGDNDIDKNRRNVQRRRRTSSSSDSEDQEEGKNILHREGKGSHLLEEDDTLRKAWLHSNGDERTSRNVTRDYECEEGHRTSGSRERDANKEYDVRRKDWKTQGSQKHEDVQQNTNSDSSDSEQNEQHAALEKLGGVKRQGSPLGKSDLRQRSCSRSTDSDRSASRDGQRNRKSRHHHHRHHHRHHRHHHKRNSTSSDRRAVRHRSRDSSSN